MVEDGPVCHSITGIIFSTDCEYYCENLWTVDSFILLRVLTTLPILRGLWTVDSLFHCGAQLLILLCQMVNSLDLFSFKVLQCV